MTMTDYAPTVNPGDTRRRTRYIGIRTPLNVAPTVEVLEQDVIRTKTGEAVLADLGSFPTPLDLAEVFPLRNPVDDSLTGDTATAAQAMALIYSWVRAKQLARDAATPTSPE